MSGRAFLDTNVLVYAYDASEPKRMVVAQRLLEAALRTDDACISAQVLGEFFVTVTRKIRAPLTAKAANEIVALLGKLTVVTIDLHLVRQAIRIQGEHGLSYWDALILAAAARGGCEEVLTEDLNPGQAILGMRIRNPFSAS